MTPPLPPVRALALPRPTASEATVPSPVLAPPASRASVEARALPRWRRAVVCLGLASCLVLAAYGASAVLDALAAPPEARMVVATALVADIGAWLLLPQWRAWWVGGEPR